jgi:phage repressor protein C with HTH and peptisase S24 domain
VTKGDHTPLQRNLRRLMKERDNVSARAVSLGADLNETAVKAILSGKSKSPRLDTLEALAKFFRVSVQDLTEDQASIGRPASDSKVTGSRHDSTTGDKGQVHQINRDHPPFNEAVLDHDLRKAEPLPGGMQEQRNRTLPVLGSAMAGPDGYFEWQGQVIEHIWRPPSLATVKGAFALYVVGESMSPRYEEGELLHCHTARRPRPRDYVVVEMHPEHEGGPILATIGRYVRQTANHIELGKLNPVGTVRLPTARVNRIHIIVGTGQS